MKFLLQESFRLKNDTILTPHWDEWFNYHDHNAVDYEEVKYGIAHLGQWVVVSYGDEHPTDWRAGIDLYCISRNEIVEVVHNHNHKRKTTGLITVKSRSGEVFDCPIDDLEHPELIRRIADVDDEHFKKKCEIVKADSKDGGAMIFANRDFIANVIPEYVDCVVKAIEENHIKKMMDDVECLDLLKVVDVVARKIFKIDDSVEDIGLRLPWKDSGNWSPKSKLIVYTELGHIPDKYNHGLDKEWEAMEKEINKRLGGTNYYFESINAAVWAIYKV